MRLLLIGSRSYVLRSIGDVALSLGFEVCRFASMPSPEEKSYDSLDGFKVYDGDIALMVATPGDHRSRNVHHKFEANQSVLSFQKLHPNISVSISTLRVESFLQEQSRYAQINLEFERQTIEAGSRYLRLPNFWGVAPTKHLLQGKLAPWRFMFRGVWPDSGIRKPDSRIGFVQPIDVLDFLQGNSQKFTSGQLRLSPTFLLSPNEIRDLYDHVLDSRPLSSHITRSLQTSCSIELESFLIGTIKEFISGRNKINER